MALFDYGNQSSLADVLGNQAKTETQSISQDYAKQKRKAVSQGAASGRLTSGVQNYTMGDINANQAKEVGVVQSNLADALATIPTNDYASSQEFDRNIQLAELIAKLNKPNPLMGLIGGATSGAGAGSAFGPYGAIIGGVAGGAGGYAASN